MFFYLRNLRRRYFENNKAYRYFAYASGEVLLVVIGILIALQVNNWNENKKETQLVTNALQEIFENLKVDTTNLNIFYQQCADDETAQNRVIRAITERTPWNDQIEADLGRVMLARNLVSVRNGYDLLKDIGIAKVKDNELRSSLVSYYDLAIPKVYQENKDDYFEFEQVFLPYAREHFEDWLFGKKGIPLDYGELQQDHYFLVSLKFNLTNKKNTANAGWDALEAAKRCLRQLEENLKVH